MIIFPGSNISRKKQLKGRHGHISCFPLVLASTRWYYYIMLGKIKIPVSCHLVRMMKRTYIAWGIALKDNHREIILRPYYEQTQYSLPYPAHRDSVLETIRQHFTTRSPHRTAPEKLARRKESFYELLQQRIQVKGHECGKRD